MSLARALFCLGLVMGGVSHASAQAEAPSGPGADPAAPTPTTTTPATPRMNVEIAGNMHGLTVQDEGGTACEPRCTLSLTPGLHRFGLSLDGGDAAHTDPIRIERPGLLRAEYIRRSGLRGGGWATIGISGSLAS
ncbi:MAG: hypothetical protein AB8I08_32655 [Sandaracinaceae bacterium]